MQSFNIPNGVKKIGQHAFSNCISLQSVNIPDSITRIDFDGCSSLQEVNIPDSVSSISLIGCSSLRSITIPNNMISIGWGIFRDCSSLKIVNISKNVTSIDEGAFSGCSSLECFNVAMDNICYTSIDGILYSKDLKQLIKVPMGKKLVKFQIPDNVTCINRWAFHDCSSLLSLEISKDVISIDEHALWGCSSLKNINVALDNLNYTSIDGVLYSKDLKRIICFPLGKNLLEYRIPYGVISIDDYTFGWCTSLQNIDIPESVTFIGENAFRFCVSLQNIHLHYQDVKKCKIGYSVFNDINFETCTLYVPSGTRWAYRHHPVFSKFKNIVTERQK